MYISKYTLCINIKDINTLKLYEQKDEISIIITCKKISMGYDFPMIDMVVFADAKCEKIDISQCIGRGLRTISDNPDKVCHILLPVNEEQLISSKYATIISYFDYIKYECDYDILSSKSWNTSIKPPRKPDDNGRVYRDEYGYDIECDFNDESLKTKISEKYSIASNKNYKYSLDNIIKELIENNISSYSEYEKYQTESKTTKLYSVEEFKKNQYFSWKLTDTKNKYYKTQKECEKEIKKKDKQFKKSNMTIDNFIEYNKLNPKIPPMLLKDFYGIYCRNMKECFHNNQKVRHIIKLKDSKEKEDIWEGIYNKEKDIVLYNKTEYTLNKFVKEHYENIRPDRTSSANAWKESEYYCKSSSKWITTFYMNPI